MFAILYFQFPVPSRSAAPVLFSASPKTCFTFPIRYFPALHLQPAWLFPALYSSHRLPSFFPCALHTYFPALFSVHVNIRYFAAPHLQPAWIFPALHSSHWWPSFFPCALRTYFPALFFCPRDLWSWWRYRNQEAHCKRGSCPLRSPNSFVPKKFWKTRRSWSRGIVSFLNYFF